VGYKIIKIIAGLPGNLKRVTTSSSLIPEIDGLRFLAIIPVIFQHYSERIIKYTGESNSNIIAKVLSNGHVGVYLFFAISGFILALPFGKFKLQNGPEIPLKKYYIRRLTRLEPPYIITMSLFFLVLIFIQNQDFINLLPHFVASLLYIHRIVYGEWTPINPPAWTLEVEVQFYLLTPVFALLYFSIKDKFLRRGLIVLTIVLKVILTNMTTILDNFYLTLPYLIEFFSIGILLADLYLSDKDNQNKNHGLLYDVITLISIVVLFSSWTWNKNLIWKFVFLTSLFLTIFSCFRSHYVKKFFQSPWITAIGGMCYTIYLLHLGLAEFYVKILFHLNPSQEYLTAFCLGLLPFLILIFIVSVIFFKLIEQPCMNPKWTNNLYAWIKFKLIKSNSK